MTTEITEKILKVLNKNKISKGGNVSFFLENAPSHPNILQEGLKHKTGISSQKHHVKTTAFDVDIIRNFMHKYGKLFIRYVLISVDLVNGTTTEIIKDVIILKVIEWIHASWADVSEKTIKNFFGKCGFGNPNAVADKTVDHEFEELLQDFSSLLNSRRISGI